jgi:uncharacterized membrane protein
MLLMRVVMSEPPRISIKQYRISIWAVEWAITHGAWRLMALSFPATRAAACAVALSVLAFAGPAFADHLHVPPGSPRWMGIGAAIILYAHISGGTVGLMAGTVALLTRKGGRLHRLSGNIFFVAMLVMTGIGAVVAPFIPDRVSSVAGFMSFYLIFSGWLTVRRRREGVGALEIVGLIWAISGAAAAMFLSWLAAQTPEHTLDGAPPQAFYVFVTVSTIAALADFKVILKRGITGAQRIARHVWRMCFGLFVASGSLFLGQAQVFPDWMRQLHVLPYLALAPLPFMLFWMFYVRLSKRYRGRPLAAAPA